MRRSVPDLQLLIRSLREEAASPAPTRGSRPAPLPPVRPGAPVPVLYRVETTDPVVFITIDDGWTTDPAALDLIASQRVPVTTFLLGVTARHNPAYWRRLVALGGVLEAHTMAHARLARAPVEAQKAMICEGADVVTRVHSPRPRLLRPPYGLFDDGTRAAASACGQRALVMWTVEVRHGQISTRTGQPIRAGDIILMHWTPELVGELQLILGAIRARGLRPALLEDYLLTRPVPRAV